MCHYTHFTTEEREMSRVMRAQGFSDRVIAKVILSSAKGGQAVLARMSSGKADF
ncbi:MAG: hypothetical protein NC395_06065 [Prevotella sp.]|nr:hypothetical protein [Prevotella sp.]